MLRYDGEARASAVQVTLGPDDTTIQVLGRCIKLRELSYKLRER